MWRVETRLPGGMSGWVGLLGGMLVVLAVSSYAADDPPVAHYTAYSQNMTGEGQSGPVDIRIQRWSTEAEREALITAVVKNGPRGLLERVRKTPVVGVVKGPTTTWIYDLRFAWKRRTPDRGQRIFLATDRFIDVAEEAFAQRKTEYPFALIEIRLNPQGSGDGRWSNAARARRSSDGKTLELEDYASLPVRLINVRRQS